MESIARSVCFHLPRFNCGLHNPLCNPFFSSTNQLDLGTLLNSTLRTESSLGGSSLFPVKWLEASSGLCEDAES